jgi:hypothetical protein
MKTLTTILFTAFLGIALIACSSKTAASGTNTSARLANPNQSIVGEYHYTGFDDKGMKIIEGRITIASVEPRRIGQETQMQIKGSWDLKEVAHRDRIGLQVGTGNLDGSIINGEVIIDLNPNISDANVYLHGHITDGRYTGTWKFVGYAGPVTQGTFEAVKK